VRFIASQKRVRGGAAAGDGGSHRKVGNEGRGREEVREIHRVNGGF